MKKIKPLYLLLGLLAFSCTQESVAPFESCESFAETTPGHPFAEAYQAAMDEFVAKGVPGASAVIYTPDEGLWVGASGKAIIERDEDMKSCNLFFSASLAKTYHVVAALALAEEGLLDIDKKIDQYLKPEHAKKVPNSSKISVKELMNHTSGIPDFIENTNHVTDYFHDLNRFYTQDEYLDYIKDKKPMFEPGSESYYSNTNTVVLALIMDEVYGSHAKAVSDKIIEPLGLDHTFYKNETAYPNPPGLSNCYLDLYGNGTLQNSTDWESNFSQMSIGHDGMIINPYDNYIFLKNLFEGQLIGSQWVDTMLSQRFVQENEFPITEGLGIEIATLKDDMGQRIGHNGGSLGGAHEMRYYPKQGIYICLSANLGGFIDSPIANILYPSSLRVGAGRSLYDKLEEIALGM